MFSQLLRISGRFTLGFVCRSMLNVTIDFTGSYQQSPIACGWDNRTIQSAGLRSLGQALIGPGVLHPLVPSTYLQK